MCFIGRMLGIRKMQTNRWFRYACMSSSMRRYQLWSTSDLYQQQSHRKMPMSTGSIWWRSIQHDIGLHQRAVCLQHRLSTNTIVQSTDAHLLQRMRSIVLRRKCYLYCWESNASMSVSTWLSWRSNSRCRMQIGRRMFTLCRISCVRTQSNWCWLHMQMSTRLHWISRINWMPSDRSMRQWQWMSNKCTMH